MSKNEIIKSASIERQPEHVSDYDGLSIVRAETDSASYVFSDIAISYSIMTNKTIAQVGQLVKTTESVRIYILGSVTVSNGEDFASSIASFLVGCNEAYSIRRDKKDGKTARERLAEKLAPVYKALGEVLSTEAGKTLAAMAYDAGNSWKYAQEEAHKSARKYATKQHESDTNRANYWMAKRHAYIDALSWMVCERMNFAACQQNVRRVINTELGALEDMTDSERSAIRISSLLCDRLF